MNKNTPMFFTGLPAMTSAFRAFNTAHILLALCKRLAGMAPKSSERAFVLAEIHHELVNLESHIRALRNNLPLE